MAWSKNYTNAVLKNFAGGGGLSGDIEIVDNIYTFPAPGKTAVPTAPAVQTALSDTYSSIDATMALRLTTYSSVQAWMNYLQEMQNPVSASWKYWISPLLTSDAQRVYHFSFVGSTDPTQVPLRHLGPKAGACVFTDDPLNPAQIAYLGDGTIYDDDNGNTMTAVFTPNAGDQGGWDVTFTATGTCTTMIGFILLELQHFDFPETPFYE